MTLDIRLPIGMMFTLIGAMLAIYGFISRAHTEMFQRSLGININLVWGCVLLVFGLFMLGAALLTRNSEASAQSAQPKEPALK